VFTHCNTDNRAGVSYTCKPARPGDGVCLMKKYQFKEDVFKLLHALYRAMSAVCRHALPTAQFPVMLVCTPVASLSSYIKNGHGFRMHNVITCRLVKCHSHSLVKYAVLRK
jgi:hypothetical protein